MSTEAVISDKLDTSILIYPSGSSDGPISFHRLTDQNGAPIAFTVLQNNAKFLVDEKATAWGTRLLLGKQEAGRLDSFLTSLCEVAAKHSNLELKGCYKHIVGGRYSTLRSKVGTVIETGLFKFVGKRGNPRERLYDIERVSSLASLNGFNADTQACVVTIVVTGYWVKAQKMTEKPDEPMWGLSLKLDSVILDDGVDKNWFIAPSFRARLLTAKRHGKSFILPAYSAAKRQTPTEEEAKAIEERRAKRQAAAKERRALATPAEVKE